MSQYVHSLSDYVNSILNKSPSKNCYTFAKQERFKEPKHEEEIPLIPQTAEEDFQFRHRKNNFTSQSNRQNGSYLPGKIRDRSRNTTFEVRREVQNILKKFDRSKSKSRSKSRSPARRYHTGYIESPNTQHLISSKQNKITPTRSKPSPHKEQTLTQYLQEIDHPSKHMTIGGYYPVGIEISGSGRYAVSTMKSIAGHKFGKTPPKNASPNKHRYPEPSPPKDRYHPPGPGHYQYFSEFGKYPEQSQKQTRHQ